jgi:hypothetical protein
VNVVRRLRAPRGRCYAAVRSTPTPTKTRPSATLGLFHFQLQNRVRNHVRNMDCVHPPFCRYSPLLAVFWNSAEHIDISRETRTEKHAANNAECLPAIFWDQEVAGSNHWSRLTSLPQVEACGVSTIGEGMAACKKNRLNKCLLLVVRLVEWPARSAGILCYSEVRVVFRITRLIVNN